MLYTTHTCSIKAFFLVILVLVGSILYVLLLCWYFLILFVSTVYVLVSAHHHSIMMGDEVREGSNEASEGEGGDVKDKHTTLPTSTGSKL